MKKVFLVLLACVIAVGVQAQSKNNSNGDKGSANQSDPNRIYEFAEDMPEFIGGLKAYEKWLKKHVNHLDESGRCVVQFVVERDGSISNAKILNISLNTQRSYRSVGICFATVLKSINSIFILNIETNWEEY